MAADKRVCPPAKRAQALTARRMLKMARSAHAYVRGNTVQFYEWLERGGHPIPAGPDVWICGDCHVSNIGPIADASGHVDVQIRDLDQTVVGNPAHDIIRLGVSLATAARGSDLPGVTTAQMMEQLIGGYVQAMQHGQGKRAARVARPDSIHLVVRRAIRRRWKHLAAEAAENVSARIPLGKRFWPLSTQERDDIRSLVATDEIRSLATALSSRDIHDPVRMLDAAFWVKGCSSLGLLRYAVLLKVGNGHAKGQADEGTLCLLDIKEAVRAAAPRTRGEEMPRDNAARVIEGAMHIAPNLGDRMLGARIAGKAVFVRELRPQDLKFDLDRLSHLEAGAVARYLGNVVGRAHAGQMSREDRRRWAAELARNRPKSIDTPSWLWRNVVELVQLHEGGYLEHCRRWANAAA